MSILCDLYDGAYGCTLRIDARELRDLAVVRQLFVTLGSVRVETIHLESTSEFSVSGARSLQLRQLPLRPEKRVTLEKRGSDVPTVDWANDRAGWLRLVGLVDGMIAHGGPAHQYLSEERRDDALIELAYRE